MAFDSIQNDRPIVTRKEAMAAGEKYYFTGKACLRGHVDTRHIKQGCVTCDKERSGRNYLIRREDAGYTAKQRQGNAERMRTYRMDPHRASAFRDENREYQRIRRQDPEYRKSQAEYQAVLRKDSEFLAKKHEYMREWSKKDYKKKPEQYAERYRNRRARINNNGGSHTADDILKILESQSYLCTYCHADLTVAYHIDHIMPLSLGGSNWPSNLQCTCPPCNLSKGSKHPLDFAKEKGRLV